MKFLMVAAAIISSHCIWGAVEERGLPGPFVDLPPSFTPVDSADKTHLLGSSLNSPEVAGIEDGLDRSIESPPPSGEQSPDASTDRSGSTNSTCALALSEGVSPASGTSNSPPVSVVTPIMRGGEPPVGLELALTPLSHLSIAPSINPYFTGHFSKTTYDLLVCGVLQVGGLTYPVQSLGNKTPCLHYFQSIPTASLDEIDNLYRTLKHNLSAAAEDFKKDCNHINPTLRLTSEKAEELLKIIQKELLSIWEDLTIPY
jgi:hypothetical protein